MIVNNKTLRKSLKYALIFFVISVVGLSIRVKLLGPVGYRDPGSAAPHYHIASWQEFYGELYYIFGCSILGALSIFLFSLPIESDKERNRMELERQEKENKTTEQQTNLSDNIESKEV